MHTCMHTVWCMDAWTGCTVRIRGRCGRARRGEVVQCDVRELNMTMQVFDLGEFEPWEKVAIVTLQNAVRRRQQKTQAHRHTPSLRSALSTAKLVAGAQLHELRDGEPEAERPRTRQTRRRT